MGEDTLFGGDLGGGSIFLFGRKVVVGTRCLMVRLEALISSMNQMTEMLGTISIYCLCCCWEK